MKKLFIFVFVLLFPTSGLFADEYIGNGWSIVEVNTKDVMGILYTKYKNNAYWNLNERIGVDSQDNECITRSFIQTGRSGLYFISRCVGSNGLYQLSSSGRVKRLSGESVFNYELLSNKRVLIEYTDFSVGADPNKSISKVIKI